MRNLVRLILPLLLVSAGAAGCKSSVICPAGYTACGDRCMNLLVDRSNCGACGRAVGALEICSAGVAVCAPGISTCGGVCTDLARDPAHCGDCATACGGATSYCTTSGGTTSCTASCPGGFTACGQACVDPQADQLNCGACGHACAAGQTCRAGACRADLAVACYATNEVFPVDATLAPAGPPWLLPAGPTALAVSGSAVYAANGTPQASVSTLPLDPSYGGTSVQLTGSDLEGITPYGGALLVTNSSTGTLAILSPSGTVLGEIPMPDQPSAPFPHGVAGYGTSAWVALYGDAATGASGQSIVRVDLSNLGACAAGPAPCGSVVSSIDLRNVAGASNPPGLPFPSDVLTHLNGVFVTLANLQLDGGYYTKPAGSGKLIVLLPDFDATYLVDLGPSCANPGGMAGDGYTLWVACGSWGYPTLAPPAVVPVDLSVLPLQVGTALPLPGIVPGKVAICGGVGYVTDQASGKVVRFDPVARTVEPPVTVCPTSAGPFGYAWASDIACSD